MISIGISMQVMCASTAGIGAIWLTARNPRKITDMVAELDEDLLNRVSWLVDGPERDSVHPFEIMDAIGGRRGLLHLLRQAQLITGITTEAKKLGAKGPELDGLREKTKALWFLVGCALLWPTAHAQRVACVAADLALAVDDALIQIDGLYTPAL